VTLTLGISLTYLDLGMKMNKTKRIKNEKKETAKFFKSRCYICRRPFGKRFLFHHKKYIEGERIHSDFKSTTDYNEYILPRIKKDKKRFLLLCSGNHQTLERIKRMRPENRKRLYRAVKMSI